MPKFPKIVNVIMGIHAIMVGAIFLTGYLHGVAYGAETENAEWLFILGMVISLVDFPVAYLAEIMGFSSYGIFFIWIGGTLMWGGIAWVWVKVYRKLISGPQ